MTAWVAAALSLAWCVTLLLWTRRDVREYERFGALTDPVTRARTYWRWLLQSLLLFGGGGALTLLVLGRAEELGGIPAEFAALAHAASPAPASDDYRIGMAIGFVVGMAGLVLVTALRRPKTAPSLGAFDALIPRSRAERFPALLLCLNAGVSEELCFRLALPLSFTLATGSALLGVVAAVLAFGLLHAYQGARGVLGTAVMGALFTSLYLGTGSLWWPMLLHAAIDVMGLLVRPAVTRRFSRSHTEP